MAIGDRIKALRKKVKLTQEEFAGRLAISKGFVSNLEKDRVKPSAQLIRLISYEFAVSEYWLTTGEGEMFLSPKEIIQKQIDRIGEKAYFEAVRDMISRGDPAIWAPITAASTGSHDLDYMITFLMRLWEIPDEDMRAWARVQFARAFPPDIEKEIEKKRTEALALPALIHQYINKDDDI